MSSRHRPVDQRPVSEPADPAQPASAEATMRAITAQRLFAIVRGISPEHIVAVAEALRRGGVRLLEVAIDHTEPSGVDDVVRSLALIRAGHDHLQDLIYGAGTVLTPDQVRMVDEAGARFIVSPNVDREVIKEAVRRGMVSLPGAMTPTEIVTARKAGAHAVKLFPAAPLGPGYLKALGDPLKGVPLIAVGGISDSNLADFLAAGAVAVGIGGGLVEPAAVAAGDFAAVERRAKAIVDAVRRAC